MDRVEPVRVEQVNDEAADDARLVGLVLDGEGDAFNALVRKHQRQAVAVAYRVLGNSDDAADIAQDALLRAYRNLGQLSDPYRFRAWMLRIVTNLSLNRRRAKKVSAAGELDETRDSTDQIRAPDGSVYARPTARERTQADELGEAVRAAIATLPDKQRLSLVLSSIENVPQKEIAEILNCTVELVKWNVFQARKALKELLTDYMPGDGE